MNEKHSPATKIAVMIGQLPQGGSERQLYAFLKHCDRERWDPIVYVGGGPVGFWDEHIRELGIPIKLLQGNPVMRMWKFRQSCKANGIKCFFSWSAHTNRYGLALGLGARRIGSYRNAYRRNLHLRYGKLRAWLRLTSVSTIVCNSEETATAVRNHAGRSKRVVYIPNSVQPVDDVESCRRSWRQQLRISEDETLILGVGRLDPQKNFGRFSDMVAHVHQAMPIKAVVAGRDDGCLQGLQKQVDLLGLDSNVMRFIGSVPDARELMCAADIFVLSSDYEGMPNVVLEAMAARVPCVCTHVNGVGALIDQGVTGFVTDHQADDLAAKVLLLSKDKKLRAEMGARAAKSIKAFKPETIAARMWELCA